MTGKFLEILLAAAIAFTATDWGFKGVKEGNLSNTYNPNDLTNGQTYASSGIGTSYPHQQLTFKEEQTILNTIINLEESQRRTVARPITNFFAYPLVSQSSDGQSYGSESDHYSPGMQSDEIMAQQEGTGSPLPGRPSSTQSWPPSPPSPIDDGGLFGAIGYAPWSNNQYFDIESFLSADFPSELPDQEFNSLSQDDFLGSASIVGVSWLDKKVDSLTSDQAESLEELAQFLESSMDNPTSPALQPKKAIPELNYPSKSMSSEPLLPQLLSPSKTVFGSQKLSEVDGILQSDYSERVASSETSSKGKGNPIADVKSYDYMRDDPPFAKDRQIKREPTSPQGSEGSWSKSSDNECSGYASSTTSSYDNFENGRKKGNKPNHNKQIWLDLPYTKDDLIKSKIEEFNEIITKLDPLQQHIAKDIRRKGKNKLAARNCRKRKIDAIDNLGEGVGELERRRQMLVDERLQLQLERDEIIRKTEFLYEHIFKNLRDERGQPYSKDSYSLTYTADGSVYLVPKQNPDAEQVGSR